MMDVSENAEVDIQARDLSGSDNYDDLKDDEDLLDLHENRLFPSDDHLVLINKIPQLKASNHAAFHLVQCLPAVHSILCNQGQRMRQADLDSVRRFFRDDMYYGVDKMLQYPNSIKVANDCQHEGVMEVLQWVVCVAADALCYRAHLDPADVVPDLDEDILPVAQTMLNVFNQHRNLHQLVKDMDVPVLADQFQEHVLDSDYARPIMLSDPDELAEGEEPEEPALERHRWLVVLINTFATLNGFQAIISLLKRPATVSFPLLNMMTAVLAQVIDFLSEEAHEIHSQVIGPILDHASDLVEGDHDKLHNYGEDRTYNAFQCLVNINLQRVMRCSPGKERAVAQLRHIQTTFVLRMLESSTFNKLLSGVKECNKLLKQAANDSQAQLQSMVQWIEMNDIVQRILRTNLHQKQYVQEVQGIMVTLTENEYLTPKHLDLLWGVIEKEDTHEAVKTHMFELLGKLAASFVPSQLDMLFGKLERRQERSLQDTKRLLMLLQQLAESDSDFVMEEKLVQMVWDITIPASAPRELLDGKPLINVLSAYASNAKSGQKKVMQYMRRCFDALVDGQGGQVPLLRTLRELLKMLPDRHVSKEVSLLEQVVDQFVDKGLMTMLVGSLCNKVAAARKAVTTARSEQLDNTKAALAAGSDPDDEAAAAAVTEAAIATLADGSWSYIEVLREILLTLRVFASAASTYFEGKLAEKLWHALMVNPPYHEDQLGATQAFFKVGFQGDKPNNNNSPTFEQSTQQTLLEKHMVLQDASKVVASAVNLFLDIFQKVNLENKVVSWYQTTDSERKRYLVATNLNGIKGLDFVWSMYLHNPDRKIARHTKDQLLQLYHGYLAAQDSAPYHKALVKRLVSLLRSAAGGLTGSPDKSAMSAQAVSRCLTLALAAVRARESQTMPPVPAHHLAWRGTPLHLDVQQQGVSRLKVISHSNEYVGLLRQRIARQLGCGAKHVRMLLLGQELRHDSWTLPHEARNRAVLNAMASPEPNLYTLSPAEYRPYYEEVAFAWLLSQADGLYPLLLRLVDTQHMGNELRNLAQELLSMLPTYPALTSQLAAALDGPDKHQQMAAVFEGHSIDEDKKRLAADDKPYQTLYALQALTALLFPTFDESLMPVSADGDEVMAEASACPSPAAAAGGTAAASHAQQPAASAALQQLQKVQHRELQQQEFLQCRGLEVVLAAAQTAASCCKSDLKLQRQLSELLVMMLHNLIDKAHMWSGLLGSGGGDATSGAESGAGVGTGPAVGANGEAAVMSGTQLQFREAGSSSAPGGGTVADLQVSSVAGQTAAEQQQPASPSMEDAMSSPQQSGSRRTQQQTSKQHRQRTGDLPPLPPATSVGATNGGNAAALMAQNLAAVFGSRTLKLVADTLLDVAVQTALLWGSRSTPLVIDDDDKVAKCVAETDISVVKDALGLLSLLLQHGPLVQQQLLEGGQSPLISIVLVNPHYAALRRQAAELLEKLVASEVHPKLLQWLLQQLSAARQIAESMPASSTEFYELLAGTVSRLGVVASSNWGSVPQQMFSTAGQILDDEVENLKAIAAVAAPVASGSIEAAAAADILLQGRLQLVLALVRTLDRRSVGSDREGGLIRLLLQDFLFPEAVQQLTAAAGRLDLAECACKLEPRCATPVCRKAALELLSELMGDTTGSLEEGVGLLIDLHYQQPQLIGWNMLPRMLRAPGSYMGLKNGGATCYMNAVFQQLFMQPQIRSKVLAAEEVEQSQAGESVFAQLQAMFATMAMGKATFHAPRDFWYAFKDYDGSPIDVKEHQDAYEFFTRLQDFVDQHLSSTGQPPAIKPVMGGTFVQQIICQGVDYTSEREEEFYQISVDVKGMGCLEKSLDDYVKGELMEGDNAYHVEHLGKRVAAVKRTAIKQLPQMLCIHLKRFEFDYHNQTRYKVRERFEFPLELDMFKYSADGLAAQDQQQKAADQQGRSEADVSKDGTLSSGDGGDSSSLTSSGMLGRQLSDAVQQALAAKKRESVGAGGSAYMYDLKGVVVHSGSAFTGHYYSYIQERMPAGSSDDSSEGHWFSFDDKQVTPWDVSYLESECFGGKPSQDGDARVRPSKNEYDRAHSAYMLFYERRHPAPVGHTPTTSVDACLSSLQQEQPAAAADGDDVPMTAAAALPQQQGQFVVPYNMPVRLYKQVVESNIQLMWSQHVLDKDYFRFIRQLVDSKGDLGQLSNRKARRRDAMAAPGGPACSGSSGSKLHSSMSCDPQGSTAAATGSRTPAQMGGEGSEGCGAAGTTAVPSPMAISPAPGEATLPSAGTGPAAAGAPAINPPRLSPLSIVPPPEPQTSPGPSSRRGEEAEAVAVVLLRLGVLFQFQVYLRAADGLRTESNVWTEALMGLMGAGPSSGACLQTFLELAILHPEWLNQFLVESDLEVPLQPRRWATELFSWAFETAGKRVSPALSQYVCMFVAAQPYVKQGCAPGQPVALTGAAEQLSVTIDQAVNSYLQALPPLAHAVLAFVDRLVQLVRECVPVKRMGRDQINLVPDQPDIPADAVRVLQRYAALGPWAAAHLMMVVNTVPDLADIIIATMRSTDDDEYAAEDLLPLYELLYELLQHASNIPQLTHELSGDSRNSVVTHNPYLTKAAQNVNLLGDQQGKLAHAGGSGPLMSCILPQQAYGLLCNEVLLQGMLTKTCVSSPVVVNLAGLLTFNNSQTTTVMLKHVNSQLYKSLTIESNKGLVDVPRQNWSLVALQADSFLPARVSFWLLGAFTHQTSPQFPCVLWWTEQLSWPAVNCLMFVNSFLQRLKERALPCDCIGLRRCILQVLCDQQKLICSTATIIRDGCNDNNLRCVREAMSDLMLQMQQFLESRQQQHAARINPQQQVANTAAASVVSEVEAAEVEEGKDVSNSIDDDQDQQ